MAGTTKMKETVQVASKERTYLVEIKHKHMFKSNYHKIFRIGDVYFHVKFKNFKTFLLENNL